MTVNEFLSKYNYVDKRYLGITCQMTRPRVVCKDGFSVSIQAGRTAFSMPKTDGLEHYDEVELGFPSAIDDAILEYAEDDEDATETIYPFIPVEIVDNLIEKHGGIIGAITDVYWWRTGDEDEDGITYF